MLASALAAWAAGVLIAVTLHVGWPYRVAVLLAWTAHALAAWQAITAGYRAYRGIRLRADGTVDLLTRDGVPVAATLRPGSIVLARRAWLLFAVAGGPDHAEFLRAGCCESEAWRRFQVIWRHLGAGP